MRGVLLVLLCTACGASPREPQRTPSSSAAVARPRPAPADAAKVQSPIANAALAPHGSDADKDLIADDLDQCRDVPEDWDAFADTDGCPDEDDDGDGIVDAKDHCPDVKGSPSDTAPGDMLKRPGCPPQVCKTLVIGTVLADCFLSTLSEPGMKDQDKVLRQLVQEMSSYPEIEEVTLRAFRLPSEPNEAARARAEPVRARLIALGWPARISLSIATPTSSKDPETPNLINADISKQRFEYEPNFRRGTCTLAGDVYRPERPAWRCIVRHLD